MEAGTRKEAWVSITKHASVSVVQQDNNVAVEQQPVPTA